jgi:adenylate cyclase
VHSLAHVSTDKALHHLLSELLHSLDAEEGSVLLINDASDALDFIVCESPVAPKLLYTSQPVGKGITGLAFTLQQPMVVNDVTRDQSFDPTVQQRTGVTTHSIMVVPLSTPESEFGALTAINSRREGGFSAEDLAQGGETARRITERLVELNVQVPTEDAGPAQ